jgi:hypothetical protein
MLQSSASAAKAATCYDCVQHKRDLAALKEYGRTTHAHSPTRRCMRAQHGVVRTHGPQGAG